MTARTPLSDRDLTRLHRSAISDRNEIAGLLLRARSAGRTLRNGIDRKNQVRSATVARVAGDVLELAVHNVGARPGEQIFFNFELEEVSYFFAATVRGRRRGDRVAVDLPSTVFVAERRDSPRVPPKASSGVPSRVELLLPGRKPLLLHVHDCSYEGLALDFPEDCAPSLGGDLPIRFLDGDRAGQQFFATPRNTRPVEGRPLLRVGTAVSRVRRSSNVPLERRFRILEEGAAASVWRRISLVGLAASTTRQRWAARRGRGAGEEPVRLLEIDGGKGRSIRAILSSTGETRGATAVVIPPAWGKTKETLLPLAETLVATFEKAGLPLIVVRFDGINRRGESYIEPENRLPGREYLAFTFSQAVSDIHATIAHLARADELAPSRVVLVTFSLSSIEGRRAVATDASGLVCGWIPVVGMTDLQSGLRSVSGGVDYAYGLRRGVRFGEHELVGVRADMDHTGLDAQAHELVFLEDARVDMSRVKVPVTWIHGRHDAWMDLERVRDLMSAGDVSRRKVLEVPIGHQLRTSREALETFQLIAREVGRMAHGRELQPAIPDPARLLHLRRAEQERLHKAAVDLRSFWSDYLLGRDRRIGIELMTATTAYRSLMDEQLSLLRVAAGDTLLDLGSGTGGFLAAMERRGAPAGIRVLELDFVREALARARQRASGRFTRRFVAADLQLERWQLPLADGSADGVLASLLLSYLREPAHLLREIRRVLKPGGRVVVSSLRRDADISRIYVDGVREVLSAQAAQASELTRDFPYLQRQFLNDAAKLLELEERGVFEFWDGGELAGLLRRAGFRRVRVHRSFGSPPQAVVVEGLRN